VGAWVRAMTNKKHWLGAIYPIRYFLLVIYFLLLTFFFTRPLISQIATQCLFCVDDRMDQTGGF
jgi:hypothetical protein